jgi:hypothetical protein
MGGGSLATIERGRAEAIQVNGDPEGDSTATIERGKKEDEEEEEEEEEDDEEDEEEEEEKGEKEGGEERSGRLKSENRSQRFGKTYVLRIVHTVYMLGDADFNDAECYCEASSM